MPKLTAPCAPEAIDRAVSRSSSTLRSTRAAWRTTYAPAAVGVTPRELRSKMRIPSSLSSCAIAVLSDGWARCSSAAAREKDPSWAVSTTYLS